MGMGCNWPLLPQFIWAPAVEAHVGMLGLSCVPEWKSKFNPYKNQLGLTWDILYVILPFSHTHVSLC